MHSTCNTCEGISPDLMHLFCSAGLSALLALLCSLVTPSFWLLTATNSDFLKRDDQILALRLQQEERLDRRKKAMQLSRNVDRISDVLELPALLSTAVSASSTTVGTTAGGTASANYSTALDLYSHIKRLQTLYPDSPLIKDIILQAEDAMRTMTTNLIAGLRAQNVRLAAAMRTVGWLRRVAPELETPRRSRGSPASSEGALGALFLVCRLANLVSTLEALDPLRELADQETRRRIEAAPAASRSSAWSGGQQTERFLKRYIEIYREQSFAIVSLYKNIFAPEPVDNDQTATGLELKSLGLKTTHVWGNLNGFAGIVKADSTLLAMLIVCR